jgi:hypothetical protein
MKLMIIGISALLLLLSFTSVVYGFFEIDTQTQVSSVIDGVTFVTVNEEIFKLADIQPTCTDVDNSTGYISSKSLLSSLIKGKTVYLDIDNLYITDFYGAGNKTVCVVYIEFNSTHYINVNQALVAQRLVVVNDVENDFNPEDWTRLTKKEKIPEIPSGTILSLFLITALIVTTYITRMKS